MENELIVEEQVHRKGRHRKKQLYNSIMQQMEFYFSDSNLSKDKFLLPMIQNDPFLDISTFLKFNKIRKLTTNVEDIIKAVNNSQLLELSEDKSKVKRKTLFSVKENVDTCTLYVERIKVDTTHEWLASVFSEFGNVTYVSIPKYKHKKVNKGFAFVEFEKEMEAIEALSFFETIGCRMSSLMPPENLCSIITYEGANADDQIVGDQEISLELPTDSSQKKRKDCMDDNENCKKKIKLDSSTNEDNNGESIRNDDMEEKKKKKQKKARKRIFKEFGLQVLSKTEWKKIRNRYLDNQRTKMKQLKQFLHKKKFANYSDKQVGNQEIKPIANEDTKISVEKHSEYLEYISGVIVKAQLLEPYCEVKKVKEDLRQYSTEIKYIDIPSTNAGSEAYLRFSDNDSAVKFCSSSFKGQCSLLEGKEEEEYWNKINNDRSLKFKKNQKHQRGREKLLKKAEKQLGKHIKFDDAE